MTAPGLEELVAELTALREANQAKFQDIARSGAGIDPAGVMMLRLESLARTILDEEGILHWEVNFETQMAENLERVQSEVNRAKLLAPPMGTGPGAQSAAGFPFPTPDLRR